MLIKVKRDTKLGYLRPLRLYNHEYELCRLANHEEQQINVDFAYPLEIYHGQTKKQSLLLDRSVSEIIISSSPLSFRNKLLMIASYGVILLLGELVLTPLRFLIFAVTFSMILALIIFLVGMDNYRIKYVSKID